MSSVRSSHAADAGTIRCVEIAQNFLQSIGAASRSSTATASSSSSSSSSSYVERNSPRFYSDGVWEVVREARRHGANASAATRDAVQALIGFSTSVDAQAQCSVRTAAARAVVALASGCQLDFGDAVDTLSMLSRSSVLQELEAGVTATCEVLFLKLFTAASSPHSSSNESTLPVGYGRIHPLIAIIRAHEGGQPAAQARILTRIFQTQTKFLSNIAAQSRAALAAGQISSVKVRDRVVEQLVAQNQPFYEFLLFNQTVPTKLRALAVSLLRRIVVECVLPSAAAVVAPPSTAPPSISSSSSSSASWHANSLGGYAAAVAHLLTWYAQFVGVACTGNTKLSNSALDSDSARERHNADDQATKKVVDGIQWSAEELSAHRCLSRIGAISEQHGHCLHALDAVFACTTGMGLEMSGAAAASRASTFAELGPDIAVLLLRLWREGDAINEFLNSCRAQRSDASEGDHPFLRDSAQETVFEGLSEATADHKTRIIAHLRTLVTCGGYVTLSMQRRDLGDAILHQLCDIVRFEQSAFHRNVAQNVLVEVATDLVGRSDTTASFSALVHVLVALIACPSATDDSFRCTPCMPGSDLVEPGALPWQTDLGVQLPSTGSSLALRLLKVIQSTAVKASPVEDPLMMPCAPLNILLENGNLATVLPGLLALWNRSIVCGSSFDSAYRQENEKSSSAPVLAAYRVAMSDMVGFSGLCSFGVPRARSLPVLTCALALFHPHLAARGSQRPQQQQQQQQPGLIPTLVQSADASGHKSTSGSLLERIVRQTVDVLPGAALELLPCLQFAAAQCSTVGVPTQTAISTGPSATNSSSFAHYMSILDAATALVANPRCTKAALCFLAKPMMLPRPGSQEDAGRPPTAVALALAGRLLCRTLVANSVTVGLLCAFIHDYCGLGQRPTQIPPPADKLAVQLHSLIQLCDHGGRQVGADFVKFVGNALVEAERALFQGAKWASQAAALCIVALQRLCRDGHVNFATGLRVVSQHFSADSLFTSSPQRQPPLVQLIHLALAQFYSTAAEALCAERAELLAELEECGVNVEETVAADSENSSLADTDVGSAVKQLSQMAEQINGIVSVSWNFIAKLPSDGFDGVGKDLESVTCAWWNCLRAIATLPVAHASKHGDPVVNVIGSVASASSDTEQRMRLVETRGFTSESPLVRSAASIFLTTVCSHDATTQSYMRRWRSSHTHQQLEASEPDSPAQGATTTHYQSAMGTGSSVTVPGDKKPTPESWQEHLVALLSCGHEDGMQFSSPVTTLPDSSSSSSNRILSSYASCAPEERAAMSLRVVCLYGHEVHNLGAAARRADVLEFGKSFWDLFPQLCADVEPPVRRLALRNGELANPDFWLGQATYLPAWRLFCARWLLAEVQTMSWADDDDVEGHGDNKFVDQENLLKQAGKNIWSRALRPALGRCLASSRSGGSTTSAATAKATHGKKPHSGSSSGAGRSRGPTGAKPAPGVSSRSSSGCLPEQFPQVANVILAAAALHSLLPMSYCASVKTAILRLLSQLLAQDTILFWQGGHTVVAAAAEALGFLARAIVGEASALGSRGDSDMASTTSTVLGLSKGILTKWEQHNVEGTSGAQTSLGSTSDAAKPFAVEKNQLICFLLTSALGQCAAACLQWGVVLRSRQSGFEPAHQQLVQTIVSCIANATQRPVADDAADGSVTATAHGAHVAVRLVCNAVQSLLASETFGPTIEACVHSADDTLEVFDCVKVLVGAFSSDIVPRSDGSDTNDPLSAAWPVTFASVFSVAEQLHTMINRVAASAQAESTPSGWGGAAALNPSASQQRMFKAGIAAMSAQARRLLDSSSASTTESVITPLFLLSNFAFFSHGVASGSQKVGGHEGPAITGAVRRELIQLISAAGAGRARGPDTSVVSDSDSAGSATHPRRRFLARVVGALLASMAMHAGTHLLACPLNASVTLSDESWLCRWLARSGTWGLLQALPTACEACFGRNTSAVEAGSDPVFQLGVLIHGSVLSAASVFYSEAVGPSSPGLRLLPQLANPFNLVPRDKAAKQHDPVGKGIDADVAKVAKSKSRVTTSRPAQIEAPTALRFMPLPSAFSLTVLKAFPQGSMLRSIAKSLMSAIQELAGVSGQPIEGDDEATRQQPSTQQNVALMMGKKVATLCRILADSTLPIVRLQPVAACVLSASSQFMQQRPLTEQFQATAAALTEACLRLIIAYSHREGSLGRLLTTKAVLQPCCFPNTTGTAPTSRTPPPRPRPRPRPRPPPPPAAAVLSLRTFIAANFAKVLRCAAPRVRSPLLANLFEAFISRSVSLGEVLSPGDGAAASGSHVEVVRLLCQQLAQFAASSSGADPMPRRLFQKSFFPDTWVPWLLQAKAAAAAAPPPPPFVAKESVVAHLITCKQAAAAAAAAAAAEQVVCSQSLAAVSALAVVPPTWIHVFVFERSFSTGPALPLPISDAAEAMWFSYWFHRASSSTSMEPGGVCDHEVLRKFLHHESVTTFLVKRRPSSGGVRNHDVVVDVRSFSRTVGYYALLACEVIGTNNTVAMLELIQVFAKSVGGKDVVVEGAAAAQVQRTKMWAGDRALRCVGALLVAWSSQQRQDILATCAIATAGSPCVGSQIVECYRHLLRHTNFERGATDVLQQLQDSFLRAWEQMQSMVVAEGEGPSADQRMVVRQLVVLTFEALPTSTQAVWWDRVSPVLKLL